MRAALLALLLLPCPATAQPAEAEGWRLTREHGAGHCAASLKDEAGAALSLRADVAEGAAASHGLTLTMIDGLRSLLPAPDGPLALALRPAGKPAVLLEGEIAAAGPLHVFTYTFPDPAAQRAFLRSTTPRLTVFHPEAGVIAAFATEKVNAAIDWLDACTLADPATDTAKDP